MKMEYIALAVVGIVFLVAVFQAIQLTALNEKVSSQEKLLKLTLGQGALASASGTSTPTVSATAQTVPQPSSQPRQVGGC